MPTSTYTPLATVTLGSSASSVTFSSIPATYRDLIVVVAGTTSAFTGLYLRFNGDTGTNYSVVRMEGNGSSASSATQTLSFTNANIMSTTQTVNTIQIMDYSATDKHKTFLARGDSAADQTRAAAARWASTSAITSVNFTIDGGQTFNSGCTFSLYGVIA